MMQPLLLALATAVLRSPVGKSPYTPGVFTYEHGGEDWTAGRCSSREKQSPIAFEKADEALPVAGSFLYRYHELASPIDLYASTTSLVAELAGLGVGGLTLDDEYYHLMNIKFKVSGEHPISGIRFPAEIQLVHKHAITDKMLIVAIPTTHPSGPQLAVNNTNGTNGTNGSNATPVVLAPFEVVPTLAALDGDYNLARFLTKPAPVPNTKVPVPLDVLTPLDLGRWMEGTFWRYGGSLTAPPCGLGVFWLVRQQPLQASDAQVAALTQALMSFTFNYGNARNPMPRNSRPVSVYKAERDPDDYTVVAVDPARYAYKSKRNIATRDKTAGALKDLKATVDYLRSLDNRLDRAAVAHSAVLHGKEPPLPPGAEDISVPVGEWKAHVDPIRDHIIGAVAAAAGMTVPPPTLPPTTAAPVPTTAAAITTAAPLLTTPAPMASMGNGTNATGANGTNGTNGTALFLALRRSARPSWFAWL